LLGKTGEDGLAAYFLCALRGWPLEAVTGLGWSIECGQAGSKAGADAVRKRTRTRYQSLEIERHIASAATGEVPAKGLGFGVGIDPTVKARERATQNAILALDDQGFATDVGRLVGSPIVALPVDGLMNSHSALLQHLAEIRLGPQQIREPNRSRLLSRPRHAQQDPKLSAIGQIRIFEPARIARESFAEPRRLIWRRLWDSRGGWWRQSGWQRRYRFGGRLVRGLLGRVVTAPVKCQRQRPRRSAQ